METTTNSIAACAENTPARGRFGIKNVTSGRCPNFKPNRHVAGIEPAQSAIEFVVFREEFQANSSLAAALDVDGDGLISTTTLTASQVSFNWDGLNFKKNTAWINANDAFLVLDRDFNQSVDNGTELLSNPLVADPAKGLRSLATWDANGEFTTKLIALCADFIRASGQFGTQNTPQTALSEAAQPTHVTRHCARPVRRPLMAEYRKSRSAHRPCAVASGWVGKREHDGRNTTSYYEIDSTTRSFYAGKVTKTLIKRAANDQDWRGVA